ncbi:ERCC4 domain protein [Vulcanisaeta moutnovskia 768-28]|uniref:ERCC4 domain protein n=1 Tax=Vulcanisaeta moutnovskia (strain 768-28) TaxID=985053 RepID=F0QTG1_VULM7|nr:ERCC4 domain-containing protein [Vulcanisaeta moutnovskia]ADY00503.1 ERCC4 domain protein [Vulcanisaeta moutnovskia 768-28]
MDCTIIVDSREYETAEEVIKWIKRLSCNIIPRKLDIGDYVLPNNMGIERKKAMDFISSIVDGRLFEQSKELLHAFNRAYVIVEGDLWRALNRRNVHKHSVLGALGTLIDMGIRVLYTPDEEGTAYVMKSLVERIGNKSIKSIPIKRGETIRDTQIQFLSSLPGIGPKRAEALLRAFGTPLDALNNLGQWTRKVDNINENIVGLVRKVLTTKYGDEINNVVISIDEAIREVNEKENDDKRNRKDADNVNNKHNIMDFLGDR